MSKTFAAALVVLSAFGGLAATAPAYAASRSVEIGAGHFANRCGDLGGALSDANPILTCRIGTVDVMCEFIEVNLAACHWAGIDDQIAVNRLIGQSQGTSLTDSNGKVGPRPDPKKLDLATNLSSN